MICFSTFEYIFSKKKKKTVYVPYVIPGASNKRQRDLRVKPIVDINIGFLL